MRIGEVLRCWKCSAVAQVDGWVETTALGEAEPSGVPTRLDWPRACTVGLGGHDYYPPPTPDHLVDAGRRAVDAVNRITLEALL